MVIRIRTGGMEFDVPDEARLREMQADGLLGSDAEIETPEGWRPLAPATPRTHRPEVDPWAAWSDVDDKDAESIYEKYVKREDDAEDLPGSAMAPMPRPILSARPSSAPQDLPAPPAPATVPQVAPPTAPLPVPEAALRQAVASPLPRGAASAPGPASGEVIKFPPRKRPPVTAPATRAPEPTPLLRPSRVFGMIFAGLCVLGGFWAYTELSSPTAQPVISVSQAGQEPEAEGDPLAVVEDELRGVGLGEIHEVSRPGDLGDGILIDLQKLPIDVVRVDAPVTKWVGRKADDAAEAEVRITFETDGALDRELGAIALVVGRYKLKYGIDMPVVEAVWRSDGEDKKTTLDARKAEQFYQGRIRLRAMLGIE